MINVHLNGDIVRCPNITEIHKRVQEIRDQHRICKYNIHEDSCQAWQSSLKCWQNVKRNNCSGRCSLFGSNICPGHIRQSKHARKEKSFSIDNKVYRKISSAAHYMVKASKNKTIFITLTFPPFKRKYNEKEINECFSRFSNNLHENYGVKYYIAVKEYGKNNNRVHFHMLLSIPFTDFNILNNAWCHSISSLCVFAKNALSSDRRSVIIRSPGRALRYACKYFSKSRGTKSKTRIVFISMPLLLRPQKVYNKSIEDILKGFKGIYIQQTSDFTTCFRIIIAQEFDRFCNLYLYHLFNLDPGKTDFEGLPGSLN